jgi:hypothetical protein
MIPMGHSVARVDEMRRCEVRDAKHMKHIEEQQELHACTMR